MICAEIANHQEILPGNGERFEGGNPETVGANWGNPFICVISFHFSPPKTWLPKRNETKQQIPVASRRRTSPDHTHHSGSFTRFPMQVQSMWGNSYDGRVWYHMGFVPAWNRWITKKTHEVTTRIQSYTYMSVAAAQKEGEETHEHERFDWIP